MKLFSLFSRPAWESADADKRARAVAHASDAALLERLPEIVRHDADAKVRLAAVKRIDDLSLLGDRARLDLSPEVRDAAGHRLRQLLLDVRVPLEARTRIVRVLDNAPLLELLATEAGETDLRACALERIRRVPFLAERCVKDSDAQLRLALLARIDDEQQLERIADKARKTDKQLARLARERLQAMRLAAGDPEAVAERALALCTTIDAMLRERGRDAGERLEGVLGEWASLAIADDAAIARRFRGLVDTLRHVLNPPAKPEPPAPILAEPAVEPVTSPEPIAATEVAEPAPPSNEELAARAEREAAAVLQRQRRERLHGLVARYAEALDGGRFADARGVRDELQALEREWPRHEWDEGKRLARLETQYAKLERWQQWSQRDQQKRLCDAAEALIGSGMHPDALLTRVRELQAEWDRLPSADKEADAKDGLGRRFRALISKSIAPARPYLEKRKELRGERSRELSELLDGATTALADASMPMAQLLEWRSKLNEAGSRIADLVGSDRRDAAERRKQLVDAVQARIEAINSSASEAKQKLLAQLRRQLAAAEPREQVNLAKSVMPQWKALPRGPRKAEDALWAELRALIDPVFERERDDSQRVRDERQAQQQAVAQLLADFEALAEAELGVDAMRHQAGELRQRLQALPDRQRDDDLAFDRLQARIDRRIAQARADAVRAGRAQARALASRIAQLEERIAGTRADAADETALADLRGQTLPAELQTRLESVAVAMRDSTQAERLQAALADVEPASDFAIRIELIAGIPSPDEFREQRRALQMERLANKLTGASTAEAGGDAATLWRAWLAMTGSGGPRREAFDARIDRAFAALFEAS